MEARLGQMVARLGHMEARLGQMEARQLQVEAGLAKKNKDWNMKLILSWGRWKPGWDKW